MRKTRFIVRGALVAGLYIVLTIVTGELSFGLTVPGLG